MKYEYMLDIYYLFHWFAHHQYAYPSNNEASSWVKEIETFIQLNHYPFCNPDVRLMITVHWKESFINTNGITLFLMFHFYTLTSLLLNVKWCCDVHISLFNFICL